MVFYVLKCLLYELKIYKCDIIYQLYYIVSNLIGFNHFQSYFSFFGYANFYYFQNQDYVYYLDINRILPHNRFRLKTFNNFAI